MKTLLCATIAGLLVSCADRDSSSQPLAGGSGIGAGNGLTVIATGEDGRPLAGARVVCRRLDWIPDGSVRPDSANTLTDSAGRATLALEPGAWLAELASDQGRAARAIGIDPSASTSWEAKASAPSNLRGDLPLAQGTRVCVSGLGRCALLDASGSFAITDLPAHQARLVVEGSDRRDTLEGVLLAPGQTRVLDSSRIELWSESFSQGTLDPLSWTVRTGDGCPDLCQWGNQFLSIFSRTQVEVSPSDSSLRLLLRPIPSDSHFLSGSVTTAKKRSWKGGRLEFEARLPATRGVWPLVSLFPEDVAPSTWPSTGSIDAASYPGTTPDTLRGYAHYATGRDYAYEFAFASIPDSSWHKRFHRYALEWSTDSVSWWLDDTCFHRWKRTDSGAIDRPVHLQIELHAGGFPWGAPLAGTSPSAEMSIRRIRITRPWR